MCLLSLPHVHVCGCYNTFQAWEYLNVWLPQPWIHLWNCVINCPECKCRFMTSGTRGHKQLHNQKCLGSSVSCLVSHNQATWIMRTHLVFVSLWQEMWICEWRKDVHQKKKPWSWLSHTHFTAPCWFSLFTQMWFICQTSSICYVLMILLWSVIDFCSFSKFSRKPFNPPHENVLEILQLVTTHNGGSYESLMNHFPSTIDHMTTCMWKGSQISLDSAAP